HVLPHDQRIAQLTGQPFGAAYTDGLLNQVGTLLDSGPPITALLAVQAMERPADGPQVQALDLLGRKILGNQGATLKKFGKLIGKLVEEEGVNEKMSEFITPIAMLGDQMTKFTTEIGFKGMQNPDDVGAASVDYLRVAGHLVFGYLFARMAQVALREIAAGNADPFYLGKLQTARFYFAKLFPETLTLMRTARAGSQSLMDTDAALA
ncbi:MAG: acyl-CoA dehydrogenase C-terminal domain-containing protein, partial [Comamonas sp.]